MSDRTSQNDESARQAQDSVSDQLDRLHVLAVRSGLYDAADWLLERRRCDGATSSGGITRRCTLIFPHPGDCRDALGPLGLPQSMWAIA